MKMVVADLDGTLVHQKKMSKETRQTIHQLKEDGYYFTLATGRHKDATRALVEELNIGLPVILTNGACIYDYKNETVIHQDTLEKALLEQLLRIINQKGVAYLIYTTKQIVSSKVAKDKLEKRIGTFESVIVELEEERAYLEDDVLKLLVIEEDKDLLNELKETLKTIKGIYLLQSQPQFLDIGNQLASKGRALKRLANHLGIDLKDVLAIGDQENDLSMILEAGVGVAMANAETILKEHADYVTKSVTEEGFTYAVKTLIYQK